MSWPWETRTSTCRNFATISSGLYRFLAIAVLLDVETYLKSDHFVGGVSMCRQRAPRHDQAAIRGSREGCDVALDLIGIAHSVWAQLHPERRSHGLDCTQLPTAGGYGGIAKNRHSRNAGCDFFEQL